MKTFHFKESTNANGVVGKMELKVKAGEYIMAQTKADRVERIQNGLNIKTDCFGYDKEKQDCTVMTELICMNKKCSFYKPREAAEGSSQE